MPTRPYVMAFLSTCVGFSSKFEDASADQSLGNNTKGRTIDGNADFDFLVLPRRRFIPSALSTLWVTLCIEVVKLLASLVGLATVLSSFLTTTHGKDLLTRLLPHDPHNRPRLTQSDRQPVDDGTT